MADKMVKIGAAWKHESRKTDKNGKPIKYFSGQIEVKDDMPAGSVIPFVMFRNSYKEEGDKKPDILIYEGKGEKQSEEVF